MEPIIVNFGEFSAVTYVVPLTEDGEHVTSLGLACYLFSSSGTFAAAVGQIEREGATT